MVTPTTITNCFKKSDFIRAEEGMEEDGEDEEPSVDFPVMSQQQWEDFESLHSLEEETETSGTLTNAELLAAASHDAAGEEEEEVEEEDNPMTMKEKMAMVNLLRRFVQENGMQTATYSEIEKEVFTQASQRRRQTKIDAYFACAK